MTKNFTLLFAMLVLAQFYACETPKQPVFKNLENVNFDSWTKGNIKLSANAVFTNPNPFAVQLTGTDMNLLLNGQKTAHMQQTVEMQVPPMQDFRVPINLNINPKDLSSDLLLDGALALFTNKKVKMRLNGTVAIKVLQIEFKIPIDHEQDISLKDLHR